MTNVTSDLIWINNLLTEIDFPTECPMRLHGDNKAEIHLAENDIFHEITKHIEFDCDIAVRSLRIRSLWRSMY